MPSQGKRPSERPAGLTQGEPNLGGLRVALLALLAFLLAVAAYAPALEGPFVWDDEALLPRQEIADLQPLEVYFSRPFWPASETSGGATYYRPITILSLALDHAAHGRNSTGFHLTNLLLHGLCAVLVFFLARRVRASLPAALVGALLFAWFPRLSEAAAWISGRTDLLAAFFSLFALLVTLGNGRGRTWVAAALLLLGTLSKEVALGPAMAVAVYGWQAVRAAPLRERLLRLLPLTLAGLAYAGLRLRVLGPALPAGDATTRERLLGSLEALGRYGVMIVDGWHPRLNIGHLGSPAWPYVALGAALALALAFVLWRLRPEANKGLLLLAGLGSLALVLHLLPFQTTVSAADRFLYLPLAAWAPVLAYALSRARRPIALGLAGALAVSFLPFTWQRAQVWGDDISFWGTAVREQEPRYNALSHAGLASILANQGLFSAAMVAYERMQAGDGGAYLSGVQKQIVVLGANAETERILDLLERAVHAVPSPSLYAALALAYAGAGRNEQAHQAAREFERRTSDKEKVHELWAQLATGTHADQSTRKHGALAGDAARPVTLQERLAWGRQLAEARRFRVAMTEFMFAVDDPGMTSQELRAILVFALSYGTPQQIQRVYERLRALEPSAPAEFSLLVLEHQKRTLRLRELCRELEIEVLE